MLTLLTPSHPHHKMQHLHLSFPLLLAQRASNQSLSVRVTGVHQLGLHTAQICTPMRREYNRRELQRPPLVSVHAANPRSRHPEQVFTSDRFAARRSGEVAILTIAFSNLNLLAPKASYRASLQRRW